MTKQFIVDSGSDSSLLEGVEELKKLVNQEGWFVDGKEDIGNGLILYKLFLEKNYEESN